MLSERIEAGEHGPVSAVLQRTEPAFEPGWRAAMGQHHAGEQSLPRT
ncbi:MAG: hypothetical protein ACOYXW_08490 [Actinomycetota bacterium]